MLILFFSVLAAVFLVLCALLYLRRKAQQLPPNNPANFIAESSGRTQSIEEKRKTVVLAGDSLTRGNRSCNYVDMLTQRLEQDGYVMVNAGINRDLSYSLLQRIDQIIDCKPDYVILLIGLNDAHASLNKKMAATAVEKMNLPQRPSLESFEANLTQIISELESRTDAEIALLSIPPIGEDLNHINAKRAGEFSQKIREIAEKMGTAYLPIHESIIAFLQKNPSRPKRSYKSWRFCVYKAFFQRTLLSYSFNRISESNGFHILIDFFHLNCTGAKMIADQVEAFLRKMDQPL